MAMAYMYIVSTVKRVILYGNELIHHKEQNYRLKNVPSARVATDLLHEISHNYKISYMAFTRGQLTPPTFENSGVNLKILSSFSNMRLK